MKKIIFSIAISIIAISCNKSEKPVEETTPEVVVPKVEVVEGNKNLPGYELINKSDCLSCHKDADKFVGPSYAEIANKYTEGDTEALAAKIIDGSVGVWGEVPMVAHPHMDKEEAKKMVAYIMSMKK